jgi:carboxyl-terminal processing protease
MTRQKSTLQGRSILAAACRRLLVPALLALLLVPPRVSAEPVPGKHDRVVARMVGDILQKGHVTQPTIDDEISKRWFARFLKDLDPGKLYFLKSDIEDFEKQETELDDMLAKGDISFAYTAYRRLLERVAQRQKLIDDLLEASYDFTVKEYLDIDQARLDYVQGDQELRERWRKRIKLDLLRQRLGAKALPDAEAREAVRKRYRSFARRMKQLDNWDLMEEYLSALAASLDPHSSYLSPNTVEDFEISLRLRLEGIGAVLREENGEVVVVETVPGGAAGKDGRLKPNDKIIAVAQGDGKFVDVVDTKLREAVKLIRGPKGTRVELKVIPAGKLQPVVYALTRQQIEIKSQAARYEVIEQGKKAGGKPYRIGVIDLPSFYGGGRDKEAGQLKSASEDVRRILNALKAQQVDGVVLDLRSNPGGLLTEAVALAGLFIDEGPVVQVKGGNAAIRRLDDPDKGMVYGGPLLVLVNRFSASGSEIVAATLQDYGRALIVGDSATHGKGTVAAVIDLAEQLPGAKDLKLGALRLTYQQFYRVNGDSTQNRGVVSDIVLPSLTEYLATPEKDLDHALAFDRIKAAGHPDLGMVPADLKAVLKARSAQRIRASKDFTRLAGDIERLKGWQQLKKMPLSEKELKEQVSKDEADQADPEKKGLPPERKPTDGTYKLPRNFINNEVLQIMEDFLQGRKLLPAQGRGPSLRREAPAVWERRTAKGGEGRRVRPLNVPVPRAAFHGGEHRAIGRHVGPGRHEREVGGPPRPASAPRTDLTPVLPCSCRCSSPTRSPRTT